jgi:hypothetical protein
MHGNVNAKDRHRNRRRCRHRGLADRQQLFELRRSAAGGRPALRRVLSGQNAKIVGQDLELVERVLGRMTYARAAAAGAGTGAWFGLFIGLLVGLLTTGPEWLGLILGGLLIGAFWGAVFGLVAQWSTGGQRDFTSVRGLVAARYDLMVLDAEAERARRLLSAAQ